MCPHAVTQSSRKLVHRVIPLAEVESHPSYLSSAAARPTTSSALSRSMSPPSDCFEPRGDTLISVQEVQTSCTALETVRSSTMRNHTAS